MLNLDLLKCTDADLTFQKTISGKRVWIANTSQTSYPYLMMSYNGMFEKSIAHMFKISKVCSLKRKPCPPNVLTFRERTNNRSKTQTAKSSLMAYLP
jgi:hypothetical protein